MRLLINVSSKALLIVAASWLPQLAAIHHLGWYSFAILLYYPIYAFVLWRRWQAIDFQRTASHNGYGYFQAISDEEAHEIALIQRDIEGLVLDVIFVLIGLGIGAWALRLKIF